MSPILAVVISVVLLVIMAVVDIAARLLLGWVFTGFFLYGTGGLIFGGTAIALNWVRMNMGNWGLAAIALGCYLIAVFISQSISTR